MTSSTSQAGATIDAEHRAVAGSHALSVAGHTSDARAIQQLLVTIDSDCSAVSVAVRREVDGALSALTGAHHQTEAVLVEHGAA